MQANINKIKKQLAKVLRDRKQGLSAINRGGLNFIEIKRNYLIMIIIAIIKKEKVVFCSIANALPKLHHKMVMT